MQLSQFEEIPDHNEPQHPEAMHHATPEYGPGIPLDVYQEETHPQATHHATSEFGPGIPLDVYDDSTMHTEQVSDEIPLAGDMTLKKIRSDLDQVA